jgi:hypothetical protein
MEETELQITSLNTSLNAELKAISGTQASPQAAVL